MTLIANKDTFGYVVVGDIETRHQIVAGQEVPEGVYARFEDSGAVEDADEANRKHLAGFGLRGVGYKEEQVASRLERDNSGHITSEYEPEQVDRLDKSADPTAANEPDLANEHTPLGATPPGEGETAAVKAEKADEENRKTRESEEGDSPAKRIERRLSGDSSSKAKGRSRSRSTASDAPSDAPADASDTPAE